MKLTDNVELVFFNPDGDHKSIGMTVREMLENTIDDFYEWLDDSEPCTSASCNNESQNFCDCGSSFEEYELLEVILK